MAQHDRAPSPASRQTLASCGIALGERLGAIRALTDEESGWLARLLDADNDRQRLKRWNPEDDAKLRDLIGRGRTAIMAARKLRRTPAAVRSRIKQLKAKGAWQPPTSEVVR